MNRGRLAALSGVACLATLAWWAVSYQRDVRVGSADGRLLVVFCDPDTARYWDLNGRESAAIVYRDLRAGLAVSPYGGTAPAPVRSAAFGVEVVTEPFVAGTPAPPYRLLAVPIAYFTLLFAAPAAAWLALAARRRMRRREPGQCAHCGYDLRASVERCPECGTVAAAVGAGSSTAPAARPG